MIGLGSDKNRMETEERLVVLAAKVIQNQANFQEKYEN